MIIKDVNPKANIGAKKLPFSAIPMTAVCLLGLAMTEGARKYGRHNYRATDVAASTYYDAALRHLTAWWEGEDIDPDSGLPHPAKAMACLAILLDASITEHLVDDRPPKISGNYMKWVQTLMDQLIVKYPTCVEAHCELPN